MNKGMKYLFFCMLALMLSSFGSVPDKKQGSWDDLMKTASSAGKKEWQPMLKYVADLHRTSTHPAAWPFDYEWEEIGPGYHLSQAFGHWDIIHQTLDVMQSYPQHALYQLLNDIKNQEPNGLIPGSIWLPGGPAAREEATWSKADEGHPPVWVVAVQDYIDMTGDKSHLNDFFSALIRQITWFENSRKAEGEGFYYNDILLKRWESGVDEGIRFDKTDMGKWACIDATSHVYQLYHYAVLWAGELGIDQSFYKRREADLLKFIRNDLYVAGENMFYDIWSVRDKGLRNISFENLWPLITGAATDEQAGKLIDLFVLNPDVFFTQHPVSTVGRKDPKFELRMWRGPAWNSMTYWVARGCLRYGRKDAAKILLEKALDDSAKQFETTGTIWEFYNPDGGDQALVKRKPQTKQNTPCRDYLGHNPLIAMAIMYDRIK
ncbi:MAG TPA: trehalase family glycosidase [Bacteroidales bacterium]|nr:trehalase family glycosidase [Bacteroidales bacterium]